MSNAYVFEAKTPNTNTKNIFFIFYPLIKLLPFKTNIFKGGIKKIYNYFIYIKYFE